MLTAKQTIGPSESQVKIPDNFHSLVSQYQQGLITLEDNVNRLANTLSRLKPQPYQGEDPSIYSENLPCAPSLYDDLESCNRRFEAANVFVNRLANFWEQTA